MSSKIADHTILGRVWIDELCEELDRLNPDASSRFVVHEGEIKEVSSSLVRIVPTEG